MTGHKGACFDPSRRRLTMRQAEDLTTSAGGRVYRNGAEDLVFAHWAMRRRVAAKATRAETSDAVMTWLRQLYLIRRSLRVAFGFSPEE